MSKRNGILLLASASFVWGFSFAFQSQAADVIGPLWYNGIRMLLGFFVLLPFVIAALKRHKGDSAYLKTLVKGSVSCGVVLAAASVAQQMGIGLSTAGKAGFITSMYSLLVPVFSIVLGKKVSLRTWMCVIAGLAGMFLLSINGEGGISSGDYLLMLCAVLFTIQIMCISNFTDKLDGIDLTAGEFLVCGLCCLVFAPFFETIDKGMLRTSLVPIIYAGAFSCGLGYTFQTLGQKSVQPTQATLVMCLESVWAAVGGAVILKEVMTARETAGCAIVFIAVVVAQLPERRRHEAQ